MPLSSSPSPPVSIALERDADPYGPDYNAVLDGLVGYNRAALPPSLARIAILAHDESDDRLLAGVTLSLYPSDCGTTAFTFWGGYAAALGMRAGPIIEAVIRRALLEMQRRAIDRVILCVRPHDPLAPYLAAGLRPLHCLPAYSSGGDFRALEWRLADGADPVPPPPGIAFSLRDPLSKAIADPVWRMTDQRRHGLAGSPVARIAAFARCGAIVKGGVLAYQTKDDLMIDLVWLADDLRGRGLGEAMMRQVLQAGHAAGCVRSAVETMDCQAPAFYSRLGYRRLGVLETGVVGMNMNFFDMRL
jgi:GNAT superfamily N-acetyltransferase